MKNHVKALNQAILEHSPYVHRFFRFLRLLVFIEARLFDRHMTHFKDSTIDFNHFGRIQVLYFYCPF